ncbi:MAG: RNA polymerase sigma factor RpoE [Arenicellales bacterium]
MSEQVLDLEIVRRVQQGDKQAYNLLVVKYQQKIIRLVSRFIRDPMERQDVTQEAFIKAYRALPNFRGDSAFYTWLYRIAVNTAKNYLVSAGRRPPTQDIDAEEATQTMAGAKFVNLNTPETELMNSELLGIIKDTIAELPDNLKEAIAYREFDGMSYEEIAELMDCPIGTVRSRIFRAREALEVAMKPYMSSVSSD